MFQVTENQQGYLGIKLSGKVQREEYRKLLTQIEEKLEAQEPLDILVDISELKTFTMGAIWEDVKFDFRNFRTIRKLAIVGDRDNQKLLDPLSEPFVTEEAKYFSKADETLAREWVH